MYDIQAGKKVHLGSFYTAYAAAVTAALSTTKGFQDQRDATRISGSLTNKQLAGGAYRQERGFDAGEEPELDLRLFERGHSGHM